MRRISRTFERPLMVLVQDDFVGLTAQLAGVLEGVPIVNRHQTMDCLVHQMLYPQYNSYTLF